MARGTVHTQELQTVTDVRTRRALLVGQAQAQGAVGKAEFEVIDQTSPS